MRFMLILWILWANAALADPPLTADESFEYGLKWQQLGQPQRAIDAFEQSYLKRTNALCLYHMAESYDRLARIPTKTAFEILDSKQRALDLYERFVEQSQADEPPQRLVMARARIDPLRREIEGMAVEVAKQAATLQELRNDIKQLIAEVRAL